MRLIKYIFGLFKSSKPKRLRLKDVKPGDYIYIESDLIKGGVFKLKCVNNDPKDKKILMYFNWKDKPHEIKVFDYDSRELSNFNLLNQIDHPQQNTSTQNTHNKKEEFSNDIASLQKEMNEALSKEEYERADRLQKKIDEIVNNKKT
jgi:excinuclease UvrABC helicase subunit UvrB